MNMKATLPAEYDPDVFVERADGKRARQIITQLVHI
jgi:hypothetical protein